MKRIVIDTNVLVAGLLSRNGASFQLLSSIGKGRFEFAISVPLVLEYEAICKRNKHEIGLTSEEIDDVVDYLCREGVRQKIHFLWRPRLKDPKDDMVLELAVASESDFIVTFNVKDFRGLGEFGIRVTVPKDFLKSVEKQQ